MSDDHGAAGSSCSGGGGDCGCGGSCGGGSPVAVPPASPEPCGGECGRDCGTCTDRTRAGAITWGLAQADSRPALPAFWREALLGDTFQRTTGEVLPFPILPLLSQERGARVRGLRTTPGALPRIPTEPILHSDSLFPHDDLNAPRPTALASPAALGSATAWPDYSPSEGGYVGPWSGGLRTEPISPYFTAMLSVGGFPPRGLRGPPPRNPIPTSDGCYDEPAGGCMNEGGLCKKPKRCEFEPTLGRCTCQEPKADPPYTMSPSVPQPIATPYCKALSVRFLTAGAPSSNWPTDDNFGNPDKNWGGWSNGQLGADVTRSGPDFIFKDTDGLYKNWGPSGWAGFRFELELEWEGDFDFCNWGQTGVNEQKITWISTKTGKERSEPGVLGPDHGNAPGYNPPGNAGDGKKFPNASGTGGTFRQYDAPGARCPHGAKMHEEWTLFGWLQGSEGSFKYAFLDIDVTIECP